MIKVRHCECDNFDVRGTHFIRSTIPQGRQLQKNARCSNTRCNITYPEIYLISQYIYVVGVCEKDVNIYAWPRNAIYAVRFVNSVFHSCSAFVTAVQYAMPCCIGPCYVLWRYCNCKNVFHWNSLLPTDGNWQFPVQVVCLHELNMQYVRNGYCFCTMEQAQFYSAHTLISICFLFKCFHTERT